MNNVDRIIQYLSGELTPDEKGAFEKELQSSIELREELKTVSAAYNLIRDQLWKRDEASFRRKLQEVMEKPPASTGSSAARRKPVWHFLLPLAAALAMLLVIFLVKPEKERIFSHFFDPLEDPVILALNQESRGGAEPGIALYNSGAYQKSLELLSEIIVKDPENQVAILFYLLASMETGREGEALKRIETLETDPTYQTGQALCWYSSLALLKLGRVEEAAAALSPLIKQPGPYRTDARRMQKMLLK